MKKILLFIILFCLGLTAYPQPTAGTSGLLNSPSAEMFADGTFNAGVNYLPDNVTPQRKFNYNTFNYYFGITLLPFMELSLRMILFNDPDDERSKNQDRSLALRVRVLRERKYLPAVVIGGNDILSSTVTGGRRYFKSIYIAGTKTLSLGNNIAGFSVGYAPAKLSQSSFSGFFGGITFSPSFLRSLTLLADYDTGYINAGASVLLFRHIYLFGFASDFKQLAGGIAFRLYPKGTYEKKK